MNKSVNLNRLHDLLDTFNLTLAEAQEEFVKCFRMSASVVIANEAGVHVGELMFGKNNGDYRLTIKLPNGESVPLLSSSLEMRKIASTAFEDLWQACETADDATAQKILHAIGEIKTWIDTKRKHAP